MPLPILEIEDSLQLALRENNRIILEAPTGSGKSTQVPQMLLRGGHLDSGEAIVLQPRRIAARMLAKRVAWEMGEPLGKTVGYQVRHESSMSRETRICFVTEGILMRRMISDPLLSGVSCIVFDEFHERSLHADLSLARMLMLQRSKRPDLKLVVMSATLDSDSLSEYLKPCELVRSEGRVFPVNIEYKNNAFLSKYSKIWDAAAAATVEALQSNGDGHALVFMPGAFEIGKTIEALGERLSSREYALLPLHSSLSSQDQDKALEEDGRRKVIVATNVAETSLTIDNVRLVVDSGQARVARYDASRGINTLWIEKISDASAKQRTGRAGRTAPGRAIRLWTEKEQGERKAFEEPEVRRVDLSEMLLSLLATGIETVETFDWYERPSEERLKDAISLLHSLKGIDERGALTDRGRLMSQFPLHPRYSAMLIAGQTFECVDEVSLIAALAQSKSLFLRNVEKGIQRRREEALGEVYQSDLIALLKAWELAYRSKYDMRLCREIGVHAATCRQVTQIANQLFQYAEANGLRTERKGDVVWENVLRCVLIGFPDRVCRRLDRGTLRCSMVGGRRGDLARESFVKDAPLFVASEVNEIGRQGGEVQTILNLCSPIEREWLADLYEDQFSEIVETVYDERQKRVIERFCVRFRDLELEVKESQEPDAAKSAAIFAELVQSGQAKLDLWDESVESLILRYNLIANAFVEYELDPIGEEARELIVEGSCQGARRLRDLKKVPVLPVLKDWIGKESLALVEAELPEKLTLRNGKPARLRVDKGGRLILSAKIQCLYDLADTPRFCQGRVTPLIELLAPNMRPIQMTEDLAAFWSGSYEGIKKELKGRYPKHEWR